MAPTPTAAPGPVAWDQVTDGTWEYGDYELGQPITHRLSDYSIVITSQPTLTTDDDGKTITMTSALTVERITDKWPGEDIADSEHLWFTPGNLSIDKHSETYGTRTVANCETAQPELNQTTTCTLSFIAPSEEIHNSYWNINGLRAAAWTGQKVT